MPTWKRGGSHLHGGGPWPHLACCSLGSRHWVVFLPVCCSFPGHAWAAGGSGGHGQDHVGRDRGLPRGPERCGSAEWSRVPQAVDALGRGDCGLCLDLSDRNVSFPASSRGLPAGKTVIRASCALSFRFCSYKERAVLRARAPARTRVTAECVSARQPPWAADGLGDAAGRTSLSVMNVQ